MIWDVSSGSQIAALTHHESRSDRGSVALSPKDRILAEGSSDGSITIWDITGAYLSRIFNKREFETNKDYEERLTRTEIPYSTTLVLGQYDADQGYFEAELAGTKIFIKSSKENASRIAGHTDKLRVECGLRYFDAENVQLIKPVLVDDVFKERYAVLKTVEGPAVTYTPKTRIKETLIDNIHDIPDFKAAPRKDDVAVVIGVESYQSLPNSDYSKSDAGIVKDYLKALGFQERNIDFLTDERATKSGIEKSIEAWLPNRISKGSKVFIYYSGHGSPAPTTGEAYIVPSDGDPNYLSVTGYLLSRLYEKLSKLQVSEITVVMDACFSGAGGRSVLAKGARPMVMVKEGAIISQNMVVLTATQGTQISTSSAEKGHGLFTYYFLKAIKDGKKDMSEIFNYIKPLVENEAKMLNVQQSPSIYPDVEKLSGRFF